MIWEGGSRMDENSVAGLIRVYDLFSDSKFVKDHGLKVEKNGREFYTIKGKISTNLLGSVILESIFYVGKNVTLPVMIMSIEQVKILLDHDIKIIARRRKHRTDRGMYLCIPTRDVFERIVSM